MRSRQQISDKASHTGGSSLTLVRRPLTRILRLASIEMDHKHSYTICVTILSLVWLAYRQSGGRGARLDSRFDCARVSITAFWGELFMWHDLLTDKEVQTLFLHALVILMSMAAFFGGILLVLFYVCKAIYTFLRHMREDKAPFADKT